RHRRRPRGHTPGGGPPAPEGDVMSRLQDLGARIESREARIGATGLAYVGLPLAVEHAKPGLPDTDFELDAEKAQANQAGRTYIDDVPASEIAAARERGGFEATTDMGRLGACDVIHVCVPTPLTKTRDPDFSFMAGAVEQIRKRLRGGQLVVLGSTTYPGTTHELFLPMLEDSGLQVGRD